MNDTCRIEDSQLHLPLSQYADLQTGQSQNEYEEINKIERGGNYGWAVMEGLHCFDASSCNQTGLKLPVFSGSKLTCSCAVAVW